MAGFLNARCRTWKMSIAVTTEHQLPPRPHGEPGVSRVVAFLLDPLARRLNRVAIALAAATKGLAAGPWMLRRVRDNGLSTSGSSLERR